MPKQNGVITRPPTAALLRRVPFTERAANIQASRKLVSAPKNESLKKELPIMTSFDLTTAAGSKNGDLNQLLTT